MQNAATHRVMSGDTKTGTRWTPAAMEARIVRYADLKPCFNAFIDTRTPGSEAKENFTIIGPGVSENPDQHVHIAEPHGFNIGGARQPPGCVNSQHSHDTAESFVVHTGTWRFDLGEHGDDAQVVLHPGDVISIPTQTFRGFTNISEGDTPGFLFGLLGRDDPGRVTWAPQVFDMARDYGLILLENGRLIDTAKGQAVPAGTRAMPPTSAAQVATLKRYSQAEAEGLVWRADSNHNVSSPRPPSRGPAATLAQEAGPRIKSGVTTGEEVTPIIGPGAPLGWDHGYALDRLVDPDETATVDRPEVLFVHTGALTVAWDDGAVTLGMGDTMTVPVGLARRLSGDAVVFRVSGVG
jgi:mannose-6-phosphate isomerase-like protein (cupin superfamily)